jgi:hypothetical protein
MWADATRIDLLFGALCTGSVLVAKRWLGKAIMGCSFLELWVWSPLFVFGLPVVM